jgi:hypothetical protein
MTSIEWLESMVKGMVDNGGDLGEDYPALMVHIQQAKKMHKQEIIDAFNLGDYGDTRIAEHYYNQTFKKD